MNISGIRTSAGFYDYNTIKQNEVRSQQIKEARATEQSEEAVKGQVCNTVSETVCEDTIKSAGLDKGAEAFANSYQPDAVYELKGVDSDITTLDMEKAISDMKKDQVLQQYQFFVGESIAQENETLRVAREMENFYL